MAWASVGRAGSTGNATSNTSVLTCTLNGVAGSGADVSDLLIYAIAVQNATTDTGLDEGAVLSIADSGGINVWQKIRERTKAGTGEAAQTGVVCSLWYTHVTNALSSVDTATATFGSPAQRDAQAGIVWRFSKGGDSALRLVNSTGITIGTSSSGALDMAAPTATDHLRLRVVGARTTLTALTTTAGWTTIGTTRASATARMAIFGEFLITSATTAVSNCSLTVATSQASHYALFEENSILGDSIF